MPGAQPRGFARATPISERVGLKPCPAITDLLDNSYFGAIVFLFINLIYVYCHS